MQNNKKHFFFYLWEIFSKIGGLNGWAVTEGLSANIIKMAYKTEHKENQSKRKINQSRSKKRCF